MVHVCMYVGGGGGGGANRIFKVDKELYFSNRKLLALHLRVQDEFLLSLGLRKYPSAQLHSTDLGALV